VPRERTSRSIVGSSAPRARSTASAVGDRQMFPAQTTRTCRVGAGIGGWMLGHAHIVRAGRKGGPSPSRYRSAVTGRAVARRASTARQIDRLPERLERHRAFRLELQREQIRRVDLQQRRDAIIWKTSKATTYQAGSAMTRPDAPSARPTKRDRQRSPASARTPGRCVAVRFPGASCLD
jgi:hypothetical protein